MDKFEVEGIVEEQLSCYFKEDYCPVCEGNTLFIRIHFTPKNETDEEEQCRREARCLRCNTLFEIKLEKVIIGESIKGY